VKREGLVTAILVAALAMPARAADPPGTMTVEVTVADGRITPSSVQVAAGTRLRLVVRNQGRGPAEFENLVLRAEKVLAPGASSTLVLNGVRAGQYKFVDEFHPDGPGMLLEVR
jgi:uncharacterized cupredoxin-like copper-binding protein